MPDKENPFKPGTARYRLWEKKHKAETPTPADTVTAPDDDGLSLLERMRRRTADVDRAVEKAQTGED